MCGVYRLWQAKPFYACHPAPGSASGPTTITYLDTTQANFAFGSDPSVNAKDNEAMAGAEIDGLYASALLTPTINAVDGIDSWSFPVVPLLEDLEADWQPDADGWYDASMSLQWSSIVGIPYQSIPANSAYNFTMDSSYLVLSCTFIEKATMADINATKPKLTGSQFLRMAIDPQQGSPPGNITIAALIFTEDNMNKSQDEWEYAYSVCPFKQSFVKSYLSCPSNVMWCGQNKTPARPSRWAHSEPSLSRVIHKCNAF